LLTRSSSDENHQAVKKNEEIPQQNGGVKNQHETHHTNIMLLSDVLLFACCRDLLDGGDIAN
jgi:hypothetical protein